MLRFVLLLHPYTESSSLMIHFLTFLTPSQSILTASERSIDSHLVIIKATDL